MRRSLLLLGAYARRAALEWMGYRSFLVTLVFNQTVAPLLGLAVWSAALPGRDGVSAYFIALLVVQLATASQEYYSITMAIYDGALSDDLLRPHAYLIGPIAEGLAYRTWNLLIGLPAIAIAIAVALVGGAGLARERILLALPALVLAVLLRFVFTTILCFSALWLQQAGAITDIGGTLTVLLGGIAIPVIFLPDTLRQVAMILPFRAMAGFPAEIASGELSRAAIVQGYAMQVGWLGVLTAAIVVVWHAGRRHYTAVGG